MIYFKWQSIDYNISKFFIYPITTILMPATQDGPAAQTRQMIGFRQLLYIVWNEIGEGGPKLDTVSSWTPL